MSDLYIGQITLFAGNFPPRGWAFCDGALLPISANSAMFAILGTNYGGDGRTTFGLPDLRGRVPVHVGAGAPGPGLSPYTLGEATGNETVTLLVNQMPMHNHLLVGDATNGTNDSPAGANIAQTVTGTGRDAVPSTSYTPAPPAAPVTLNPTSIQPAGGNQPHANIQPVLGLNYIICLEGLFPPRN